MRAKSITAIALGAALMAILSQFSLPLGGIPLTFQVPGVTLCSCFLGRKKGVAAIGVWLLLGAAGAPVFSAFRGGLAHLFGYSGGFLWGFLILAFFCQTKNILWTFLGVALCHLAGVLQWTALSGNSFWVCLLYGSLLYLPKDLLLAWGGMYLGRIIKKRNGDLL